MPDQQEEEFVDEGLASNEETGGHSGCGGTSFCDLRLHYLADDKHGAGIWRCRREKAAGARKPLFPLRPLNCPYIAPPNSVDLCGEPVPLDRQDVYERFDKEFTLVVYNHAQVYLWLKRMERYFPAIEERLRYYGLPDDLKYVAIVESDLLPNACSPKGAAGPWQFMPSTGSAYGLAQRGSVDKRYDFERSTDSASPPFERPLQKVQQLGFGDCGL